MAEKYLDKYRSESARAPWWNYAWDAGYFITICTGNRRWYFGNIRNSIMNLTESGTIAQQCWAAITCHAKNVELGEFVVMPNHVHGILVLKCNWKFGSESPIKSEPWVLHPRYRNPGKNTVSSIIGSYKSAVSKHSHLIGHRFAWQPRFHDHIIRDDEEYQRISSYIRNNPRNWPHDRFRTMPNGGRRVLNPAVELGG